MKEGPDPSWPFPWFRSWNGYTRNLRRKVSMPTKAPPNRMSVTPLSGMLANPLVVNDVLNGCLPVTPSPANHRRAARPTRSERKIIGHRTRPKAVIHVSPAAEPLPIPSFSISDRHGNTDWCSTRLEK